METGEIIPFIRQKDYIFEKRLDSGGTGIAVLLYDPLMKMQFVCKVYKPLPQNDLEKCFERFIDEIKILYKLSHENIVRIYNYYLYPERKNGFIIMEYINGQTLDSYFQSSSDNNYNNIFEQIIRGFNYLEINNVLHRDVKSNNILVNDLGIVKIIDFGFGKIIDKDNLEPRSIFLNWQVSVLPQELKDGVYSHKTEMYFIGKMLSDLLKRFSWNEFQYGDILEKMTQVNPDARPSTFAEILELISSNVLSMVDFSYSDKYVYSEFADALQSVIEKFEGEPIFISDAEEVIKSIEIIIKNNGIEEELHNIFDLVKCFVKVERMWCYKRQSIEMSKIIDFYKMIIKLNENKKKSVINSIITRLKQIKVIIGEDLPFDLDP